VIPEYPERRARLIARLQREELDGLVLFTGPNIRYLTGFSGSQGWLLVGGEHVVLLTDPRYELRAAAEADCPVKIVRGKLHRGAAQLVRQWRWRRVGFEANRATYETYEALRAALEPAVELVPVRGWVEKLRACKSESEIDSLRKAARLTCQAYEMVLAQLKPGLKEREIAAELDYRMRLLGAEGPAFETIVASGPHSALPHAEPGDRQWKAGEPLLMDFGAQQNGYASDLTRVVHCGPASRAFERIYRAVLEAQQAALASVREGVEAASVDQAARQILVRHKLDSLIAHATGHGVGLEIHELPRLGKGERVRLRRGMVVTVEPGVYIEGFGGVRIEDTVLVTANGHEPLTTAAKDLLCL